MAITTRPAILSSLIALSLVGAQPIQAGISEQEAARLKTELTPLGGERAGNAEGTIPEWTGGITKPPAQYVPGERRINPYPEDKVLMTIDASNYQQYSDKLGEGQKALFEKYPDTFKMNIYPTRRSASAPDFVYENTAKTALTSELTADGNGITNAYGGIPFPIPSNGNEVIWNHLLRYTGEGFHKKWSTSVVNRDGSISTAGGLQWDAYPYYNPEKGIESFNGNQIQVVVLYDEPVRRKGEFQLVIDPVNQFDKSRQAWQYVPGQRRIRRAPTIAYDTPNPAANGKSTYDEVWMFNGSPDRYDWKLVGKKEIYVAYNSYDFLNTLGTAKELEEILPPKHPNPELERWELHRVWVVEADLKDGQRHIYGKRRMYIDEDSWNLMMTDNYDGRGNLWRVSYIHLVNLYDMQTMLGRGQVLIDLNSSDYAVLDYDREPVVAEVKEDRFYTPQSLRKMSRR